MLLINLLAYNRKIRRAWSKIRSVILMQDFINARFVPSWKNNFTLNPVILQRVIKQRGNKPTSHPNRKSQYLCRTDSCHIEPCNAPLRCNNVNHSLESSFSARSSRFLECSRGRCNCMLEGKQILSQKISSEIAVS